MSFREKIIISVLLLPTFLLLPTRHAIQAFDLTNCEREVIEGWLVYYGYFVEAIIVCWIALLGIRGTLSAKDRSMRMQTLFVSIGIFLFLMAFTWGNIAGSITADWTIGQYGLLGMPIFIGFLVYVMVAYKAFYARLFGAQALVFALSLLILGILFVDEIYSVRVITGATLLLTMVLGYILVRSVKKEIEHRERIEKLANDLEAANSRLTELDRLKSEFLSFASHQIRSPLTAIKGYTSMIKEGDFGPVPEKVAEAVSVIDTSAQSLIVIVGEFLDISRIEQGRMKYEMSDFDLTELVKEVAAEQRPTVESHNLTLILDVADESRETRSDKGKVKQIIGNIIDNAIKYTPAGSITVTLSSAADAYTVAVSDTGVGMTEETLAVLFTKFGRAADARKTNVSGTGLGLYVAKQMAEALGGTVSAESQGTGKGSRFVLKLPRK